MQKPVYKSNRLHIKQFYLIHSSYFQKLITPIYLISEKRSLYRSYHAGKGLSVYIALMLDRLSSQKKTQSSFVSYVKTCCQNILKQLLSMHLAVHWLYRIRRFSCIHASVHVLWFKKLLHRYYCCPNANHRSFRRKETRTRVIIRLVALT